MTVLKRMARVTRIARCSLSAVTIPALSVIASVPVTSDKYSTVGPL